MDEISLDAVLDLQRDLHVNDFTLCEEYTFGFERLYLPFLFLSERELRFAQCLRSPPAYA